MSYYDRHWDYCYNTAYIVLGNEKAKIMLDALKESGGPHMFVSGSEEDFRFMMEDTIAKHEGVKEIVDEFVKGVEEHNEAYFARLNERVLRRRKSSIFQ